MKSTFATKIREIQLPVKKTILQQFEEDHGDSVRKMAMLSLTDMRFDPHTGNSELIARMQAGEEFDIVITEVGVWDDTTWMRDKSNDEPFETVLRDALADEDIQLVSLTGTGSSRKAIVKLIM